MEFKYTTRSGFFFANTFFKQLNGRLKPVFPGTRIKVAPPRISLSNFKKNHAEEYFSVNVWTYPNLVKDHYVTQNKSNTE